VNPPSDTHQLHRPGADVGRMHQRSLRRLHGQLRL